MRLIDADFAAEQIRKSDLTNQEKVALVLCLSEIPTIYRRKSSAIDQITPQLMTNAERLRAMSDKELAKALYGFKECMSDCPISSTPSDNNCYAICYDENTILEWLKQPAEVEQ